MIPFFRRTARKPLRPLQRCFRTLKEIGRRWEHGNKIMFRGCKNVGGRGVLEDSLIHFHGEIHFGGKFFSKRHIHVKTVYQGGPIPIKK